ncbi:unnamed protein product, partial [Mesorhabditis belari]|uniref:Distal-less n=1 Tax=Mesorhabditis belari TaxID=2138241 RepID=A0AAF3EWD7_9BILA
MGDKSAYMGVGGYDGLTVHKNQGGNGGYAREEYAYPASSESNKQSGPSYSPYGAGSQGVTRPRNDVSTYLGP